MEKRPRGRPAKTEPENARIAIRLTEELRRRIRVAAAASDMTVGAWLKEAALDRLHKEKQ